MATRITPIVPLLFITLVCVALVEGGYQVFEHFVLQPVPKVKTEDSQAISQSVTGKLEQPVKHDYRIILKRNLFGPPPGSDEKQVDQASNNTEEL
ncbi:MAG: hypothetical protein ACN4GW_13335, partial [Desulforhopalus sp.]